MSPTPSPSNPAFENKTQAQKVRAIWEDAAETRKDYNKAIGEELDFALKLKHYADDQGETRDRRRIQPKGRELIAKLRHKVAQITKDLFITVKPVDRTQDPKLADAAKWVLEYDVHHSQKDYEQVRDDWVTLALAARLGVIALDFVPGVGGFEGEVIPRVVDPRNFYWAPGWKSPHDMTCPWAIEVRRMRIADVKKMKSQGWKNVDKIRPDGGLMKGDKWNDTSLLPGTVRLYNSSGGIPSPTISDVDPTCVVIFYWARNDDTRTTRMQENGQRKLRPEQRYLRCSTCGMTDNSQEGSSLPPSGGMCQQCGFGEMDRVDREIDTEEVLSYPHGRLTICAPFSDDLELYDDNWPYKIRTVPYGVLHGYPHPLEQIGQSDTSYDWSLQLIADALLRQAYEQMSENRDLIISPVDGLVDAENEPWQFADTQGRLAYWTGQGMPNVMHFQGSGIPNGWTQIFGQVQSVLMRDMGTDDINMEAGNTKNIPVGTIQAMQATGEVPVEHHKRRLWRAESLVLSVWLDMIRDTWTQKRIMRLSPENGQEMFAEITGSDIPNADILVTAAPAIGSADEQEIRALQQILSAPPPMMNILARKLNISQGDLAEYQANMQKEQENNKPEPPPASPDKILVAMSDILKVNPSFISYEQVQQALGMAGIQPSPTMTPMQKIHATHHMMKGAKEAAPEPLLPEDNEAPEGAST